MAGILLRHSQRCKDPLFRLASNAAWELSKLSSTIASFDQCCAIGGIPHPRSQFAEIHHPVTWRHFSSSRSASFPQLQKPNSPASPPNASTINTGGWTLQETFNLPNSLSILRMLSGPAIAAWIIQGKWPIAIPALAISGATDWLDGYFARRAGGRVTVLGSYLDPLADKILIVSVVAALGYTGALPPLLVGVVIARDVVLLGGAFAIRAQTLHWKWPGLQEFFRIAPIAPTTSTKTGTPDASATKINNTEEIQTGEEVEVLVTPVAPVVKPIFISKVNTGLQLALVAACMTEAGYGWPGNEVVWGLGVATGGTTVASLVAYGRAYLRGELLIGGKM